MQIKKYNLLNTFIIVILLTSTLFGYSFKIDSTLLIPDETKIETTGVIINKNSNEPVALEFVVYKRLASENSFDSKLIESDDIVIKPQKVIIMPNQEKVVSIRYAGTIPEQEAFYYVESKQIKIESDDKEYSNFFNLNIKTNFQKKIIVSSEKFKEDLDISVTKESVNDTQIIRVRFNNKGTSIAILDNFNLQLKTTKGKVKIPQEAITTEQLLFLPGQVVSLDIPWPKKLKKKARIKSFKY